MLWPYCYASERVLPDFVPELLAPKLVAKKPRFMAFRLARRLPPMNFTPPVFDKLQRVQCIRVLSLDTAHLAGDFQEQGQ
ncbi:predicted protein [Brucella sp. 83/13]|nr:predicted protein [Brucella sp. 83/13]